jgi:hypothetical protein
MLFLKIYVLINTQVKRQPHLIASVSKLILTIIEIIKPFIPIPEHENHEHLTIQNCYCKVCPTKDGRFECSTTSDKNHPSGNSL